ncbi:hypothetical protein OK074_3018 [Actinobacteria bacterium OK074]|nr:hypothetical protein OK074_3018 [Actinobacteria bacterium OK074]
MVWYRASGLSWKEREERGPGFTLVVPGVDRLREVNMQVVTVPVPAQEGSTRDNVTVRVDAVRRLPDGTDVTALQHRQERPKAPTESEAPAPPR